MSPVSSALIIALCVTLLIIVGGARLLGVKLTRRHALPLMAVTGSCLTVVALHESGQTPPLGLSLWELFRFLWKLGMINAGAVLGIWVTGICIKDYWHPPQFIEHNGRLIPTKWVIGIFITALFSIALAWVFFLVIHRFDIFLFLSVFGVGVFGKSLAIYLVRDRTKDRKTIEEEEQCKP